MNAASSFAEVLEHLRRAHDRELRVLQFEVERLRTDRASELHPGDAIVPARLSVETATFPNGATQSAVKCRPDGSTQPPAHGRTSRSSVLQAEGSVQSPTHGGRTLSRLSSFFQGSAQNPRPGGASQSSFFQIAQGLSRLSSFGSGPSRSWSESIGTPDKELGGVWILVHYTGNIVQSSFFEAFFASVIVLNALVVAAEAQYKAMDVGVDLEYPRSDTLSADAWPGAGNVFDALHMIFGIMFTIEVAFKLVAQHIKFIRDPWNWLDSTLVTLFLLKAIGGPELNAQLLRLARLARLVRMIRLARTMKGFDALHLMATVLFGSGQVLAWACAFLFVIQLMLALVLNYLLLEYFEDPAEPKENRRLVYQYFGSTSRAIVSMFEITLGNWPPVCRLLTENVSEWFGLFAVVHKMTIGFAVVGVINGVFMKETFKVAETDDIIMVRQKQKAVKMHVKKMSELFAHSKRSRNRLSQSGFLTRQDFKEAVSDPWVKTWLSSMELDTGDADNLYTLIDANGDGKVSIEELITGVARLKGASRAVDVLTLMREVRQMHSRSAGDLGTLRRQMALLQPLISGGQLSPPLKVGHVPGSSMASSLRSSVELEFVDEPRSSLVSSLDGCPVPLPMGCRAPCLGLGQLQLPPAPLPSPEEWCMIRELEDSLAAEGVQHAAQVTQLRLPMPLPSPAYRA